MKRKRRRIKALCECSCLELKHFLGKAVIVFLECNECIGVRIGRLVDFDECTIVLSKVIVPYNQSDIVASFFGECEFAKDYGKKAESDYYNCQAPEDKMRKAVYSCKYFFPVEKIPAKKVCDIFRLPSF